MRKTYSLFVLVLGVALLMPQGMRSAERTSADSVQSDMNDKVDRFYLADGHVVTGAFIKAGPRLFTYVNRENKEVQLLRDRVLMIVYADGTVVPLGRPFAKQRLKSINEEPLSASFSVSITGFLGYAFNKDSNDYADELSKFMASSLTSSSSFGGTTFVSNIDKKSVLSYGPEIEGQYRQSDFLLGLAVAYFLFQEPLSKVEGSGYSPLNISLRLTIIPISVFGGYRVFSTDSHSIYLRLGFGMYYGEQILDLRSASATSEKFTGFGLGIDLRVQYEFLLTRTVFLSTGAAFRFAQIGKFENGNAALINGNTGKVVAAGVSGAAAFFGVGFLL